MYLSVLTAGLIAFVFCSFWVYHYVDLTFEIEDDRETYGEEFEMSNVLALPNMLAPGMNDAASAEDSYHQSFGALENSHDTGERRYRKSTV